VNPQVREKDIERKNLCMTLFPGFRYHSVDLREIEVMEYMFKVASYFDLKEKGIAPKDTDFIGLEDPFSFRQVKDLNRDENYKRSCREYMFGLLKNGKVDFDSLKNLFIAPFLQPFLSNVNDRIHKQFLESEFYKENLSKEDIINICRSGESGLYLDSYNFLEFFTMLTDYYTLFRMFRREWKTKKAPQSCKDSTKSTNIIYYGGSAHASWIYNFIVKYFAKDVKVLEEPSDIFVKSTSDIDIPRIQYTEYTKNTF